MIARYVFQIFTLPSQSALQLTNACCNVCCNLTPVVARQPGLSRRLHDVISGVAGFSALVGRGCSPCASVLFCRPVKPITDLQTFSEGFSMSRVRWAFPFLPCAHRGLPVTYVKPYGLANYRKDCNVTIYYHYFCHSNTMLRPNLHLCY